MTVQQELLQKLIESQIIATEANRQAVIAADANIKAVQENTRQVQALSHAMALHNAKQEPIEALVLKHEVALYGEVDRKGYLQRFDLIEEKVANVLKNINAGIWVLVSSILAATGAWIWQMLFVPK